MNRLVFSALVAIGGLMSAASCTGNAGVAPPTRTVTNSTMAQRSVRPSSTIAPTGMFHVMTGDYLTASNELSNLKLMAAYLTYAYTGPSAVQYLGPLQKLGVRTIFSTNPLEPICSTVNASGTCTYGDMYGYNYLKAGGSYSSVASRDCSGNVILGSYVGLPALQVNVNAPNAAAYVQATETAWTKYIASQNPGYTRAATVLFIDNVSTVIYGTPLRQCGQSAPQWFAQTAKVIGGTTQGPYIINGLVGSTVPEVQTELLALNAPNITMADAEQCFGGYYWNSTYPGNYVADTTKFHTWYANEYAEIHTIAMGKTFWCFNRLEGAGSSVTAWRRYTFASFLLGYSPAHAVYEVQLATPSNLKVFPEMMLVPTLPTVTASDVSGYLQSSGVYLRKFGACYYRGVLVSACAVAVNPNPSASVPTPSGYRRHVVLNGAGVLDGGTLAVTTGVPSSLPPVTAEILFP